ncbi:RNA polymerase sigma factor [Candidatus Galacturonibacter soehngenii]|uniref:RNA polymerase sigma factor n=1 Tax=Candidatus Galacturonatibacter soehngenii TaxID=2307010 RepID=UPI002432D1CA|nr:sigma-70 family RNA polymerase sigma factor [Candidatus Galacturonibacter soehngenii]
MENYQNLVYSICYKTIGNSFDAEDLTQEVFLSAYKKLSEFDRTYEKAWLGKIAANKCLDFIKQAGRRSVPTSDTYFLELASDSISPEEDYLMKESKKEVLFICKQLATPYQEVALEHYYKELSVQEIAKRNGKNIKTIQTQLYRAKALIKKILERSD